MVGDYKINNIVYKKSVEFSNEIISAYKFLISKKEFIMSKQLLRSGTSIGANVVEGVYAQSRKDFLHKMNLALKEAAETEYWINLLENNHYFKEHKNTLLIKCKELNKILHSIVKTTKITM